MARPKLYTSVEQMQEIIEEYFDVCDEKEKPYTMSGLAYALDMDRRSLLNYSKDEKFFPTIKKARERVEQQLEENALIGKANATFTIFNLKNNYGWKDNIEVEGNTQNKITIVNSLPKDDSDESNN